MMNANEIKKAWNTFKKEIAKEIDLNLTGCCYMNAKQIENGTATITLGLDWSYDAEIKSLRRSIAYYRTWDGDNKERGERFARDYEEKIAVLEAKKATYGTRENEHLHDVNEITGSAAFKKLANAIGVQNTSIDLGSYSKDLHTRQLRLCY